MTSHTILRTVRPHRGFYQGNRVRAKVVRREPRVFWWRLRPRWYVECEVYFVHWQPFDRDQHNPAWFMSHGPFYVEEEATRQAHAILDRIETRPATERIVAEPPPVQQIPPPPPSPDPQAPKWGDVVRDVRDDAEGRVYYTLCDPDDEPRHIGTAFVALLFGQPEVPRLLIVNVGLYRLATQEELDDLRNAAQEYLRTRDANPAEARFILVEGIGNPSRLRNLNELIIDWREDQLRRQMLADDHAAHIADVTAMGETIRAIREADVPETPPAPDGWRQLDIERP